MPLDDQQVPIESETVEPGYPSPAPRSGPRTNLADGKERRLDPASITVDRLVGAITAAVFSAILLVGVLLVAFLGPFGLVGGLLLVAGWMLLGGALLVFVLSWPPVRYRHTTGGWRKEAGVHVAWLRAAYLPPAQHENALRKFQVLVGEGAR